ncbi:hypothetical protein OF83DRAFT_324490 [Amylostereum chailletii]|nr:hypothetical protein OF83DRAFT_324490 [Amylostereum chailletii]
MTFFSPLLNSTKRFRWVLSLGLICSDTVRGRLTSVGAPRGPAGGELLSREEEQKVHGQKRLTGNRRGACERGQLQHPAFRSQRHHRPTCPGQRASSPTRTIPSALRSSWGSLRTTT